MRRISLIFKSCAPMILQMNLCMSVFVCVIVKFIFSLLESESRAFFALKYEVWKR